MDVADNTEFRNRLVALAEIFDAKLSPQRQVLYFEALRDLPLSAVVRGLNTAAKLAKFLPKPAEIRAWAVGDDEDAAERAWMGFRQAMRSVGGYSSLLVLDPALGETITAIFGGWPEACYLDLSPEMWANKRKEFGRVYRVLCARGLAGPRYLAGMVEQQNAGKLDWQKYTPVALIETEGVRQLKPAEAEQYRTAIAAQAHGFTRLGESITVPAREGETA